jgi:hypothetical protein
MKKGMGSHQSARMLKDEWLTPPEIVRSLGLFDLDPCSPVKRPWDTALRHFTVNDDGLSLPWEGRVWLNPPYGKQTDKWMERMAGHERGTALIFARTETKTWCDFVWGKASAVLFLRDRLYFRHVDGSKAEHNAGAPSALVAYGEEDANLLEFSDIPGAYCRNWEVI